MPFYAHAQNKKLLWNTIQSTPIFKRSTVDWSWFQRIIELFSEKYYTDLSSQELLDANRETILYMMEDMETKLGLRQSRLKKDHHQQQQSHMVDSRIAQIAQARPPLYDHSMEEHDSASIRPVYINEVKLNEAVNQRSTIQQFRHTYDTPKPDTPDFAIPLDPLENESIESLVEKRRKEREAETQLLSGDAPMSTPKHVIIGSDTSNSIVRFSRNDPPNVIQHENFLLLQTLVNKRFDALEEKLDLILARLDSSCNDINMLCKDDNCGPLQSN